MKPDFAKLTFTDLSELRGEFLDAAKQLFDELVGGEKKPTRDLWIDSDPFHDRPPRRAIRLSALIEVRQVGDRT